MEQFNNYGDSGEPPPWLSSASSLFRPETEWVPGTGGSFSVTPTSSHFKKPKPPPPEERKESTTIELMVPICCKECVDRLQPALYRLKGVNSVKSDVQLEKVTITGKVCPEDALLAARKLFKKSRFWPKENEEGKEIRKERCDNEVAAGSRELAEHIFAKAAPSLTDYDLPGTSETEYGSVQSQQLSLVTGPVPQAVSAALATSKVLQPEPFSHPIPIPCRSPFPSPAPNSFAGVQLPGSKKPPSDGDTPDLPCPQYHFQVSAHRPVEMTHPQQAHGIQSVVQATVRNFENSAPRTSGARKFIKQKKKEKKRTSCAEDLIREVQDRPEDGYFLSSEWLLGLEQKQREGVISILSRAGYSETYHTDVTTLFERIENDLQNRIDGISPSNVVTKSNICKDADQVEAPEEGDAVKGLDIDNMPGIATSNNSEYLPETGGDVPVPVPTTLIVEDSSNIADDTAAPTAVKDELMNMRLEEKAISCIEGREPKPGIPYGKYVTSSTIDVSLEQQPTMLESFLSALKSCHHHSYAVSTGWLSYLEEYERKELETVLSEAGYTRIHEESGTTTFERMRDDERHPATSMCNDLLSTSTKAPVGANDTTNDSASGSCGLSRNDNVKGKLDNNDSTSEPFGLVSTSERGRTEGGHCQPQVLKVTTIPSTSCSLCTDYKLYRRQQLGDTVVTMLKKGTSQPISTTMDKLFPMTTVEFAQDNSTCKEVRLTAGATTTISCCFKINHDSRKIRVKFSKISGGVRNESTSNQKRCNALVLGSLSTNVYACINDEGIEIESQENESEEINLKLEHGRREVGKFEWLQTRRNPANCEPGSITLELQGHIRQRCKADLGQAHRAHELHFEEGEGGPVVLEGILPIAQRQKLFLELNVRYQLEVSYIKPCTPFPGKARFVSGRRVKAKECMASRDVFFAVKPGLRAEWGHWSVTFPQWITSMKLLSKHP